MTSFSDSFISDGWAPRNRIARMVWPEVLVAVVLAALGHYLFAAVVAVITLSHARTLLWLAHMVAINRVMVSQEESRDFAVCRKLGISTEDIAAVDREIEAATDLDTLRTYRMDQAWVRRGKP